ncbi:MAG: hypothetical protein DRJ06_09320 [Candidatus Aminicenantes bacterium]|nr:MAG: hypothetical protein DRJ06_09320 [Candidatus Aminicenantes bacterium]
MTHIITNLKCHISYNPSARYLRLAQKNIYRIGPGPETSFFKLILGNIFLWQECDILNWD